jgi:hypothetical protein
MPRTAPSSLLLSAVATVALGTGCTTTVPGSASADTAAPAAQGTGDAVAWFDQVCGSLLPYIQTTGSPPVPSEFSDPASLVQGLADYLGDAEDAAGSAISGLETAGPSPLAGGDAVVDQLSGTLTTVQTTYRDARTRIEGVDVNDRQALLTEVPAAVESLQQLSSMPNPAAALQSSPELSQAGQDAANCQQIQRELGR